jgi:hypothetical protein
VCTSIDDYGHPPTPSRTHTHIYIYMHIHTHVQALLLGKSQELFELQAAVEALGRDKVSMRVCVSEWFVCMRICVSVFACILVGGCV